MSDYSNDYFHYVSKLESMVEKLCGQMSYLLDRLSTEDKKNLKPFIRALLDSLPRELKNEYGRFPGEIEKLLKQVSNNKPTRPARTPV